MVYKIFDKNFANTSAQEQELILKTNSWPKNCRSQLLENLKSKEKLFF